VFFLYLSHAGTYARVGRLEHASLAGPTRRW
jgi:hypothetical protein